MKKFIFAAVLLSCVFISAPCFAETVSADEVSLQLIKGWLSEKYGCKIDDGKLIVQKSGNKIIISVYQKVKLIRIYSMYGNYDKRSRAEMLVLANKFNYDKRFMRVCIGEKTSSICDFYMPYNGGLNSKNLLEALEWFTLLEKAWADLVIKE